jgi:hypothetical protein
MNLWQGTFPSHNTGEDGYLGTAPVDAFAPRLAPCDARRLCRASYCRRYRVVARCANGVDSMTGNLGFPGAADDR